MYERRKAQSNQVGGRLPVSTLETSAGGNRRFGLPRSDCEQVRVFCTAQRPQAAGSVQIDEHRVWPHAPRRPGRAALAEKWQKLCEYHSRVVRDELSVLAAFVAVAEEPSFTKAAKRLGISPSALSHALRGLEERIGVRLLAPTTRSVAPTDAGEQLLTRVRPSSAWQCCRTGKGARRVPPRPQHPASRGRHPRE
jgi:DNA-binding MarR family transcriptional regulator